MSLRFNLAISQCSTGTYQAFDVQTEFSGVFHTTHEIHKNFMHAKMTLFTV